MQGELWYIKCFHRFEKRDVFIRIGKYHTREKAVACLILNRRLLELPDYVMIGDKYSFVFQVEARA